MEIIKQYKPIIVVVSTILILVILRSTGLNHFRPDAEKLAAPSVAKSNIITLEQMGSFPGEILLINLGQERIPTVNFTGKTIHITADSVLTNNNLRMLHRHKGPILIYSADPEIVARIWMVLSQTGVRNIFILTGESDNESFKYKFRPDSSIRPELPGSKQ